jgi:ribosome-binding protein aMBF1 (putative translation factor)
MIAVGQRWRGFMVAESRETSDADRVRALLARLGMSQREGARELDMRARDMRGYCAGERVPRYVLLALERMVEIKESGE